MINVVSYKITERKIDDTFNSWFSKCIAF